MRRVRWLFPSRDHAGEGASDGWRVNRDWQQGCGAAQLTWRDGVATEDS